MRLPFLVLVPVLFACGPRPPAAPAEGAASSTAGEAAWSPEVVVLGNGDGAVLSVTFRGPTTAPLSEAHAVRVRTSSGLIEAPMIGEPVRSVENGTTRVTTASYRLSRKGAQAVNAPGPGATLEIHDGEAYQSYPLVRADLVE